jgi:DNA-binding transcriptional LysR family regulator
MNLEHLRVFASVVERRSFSAAARELGVTKSNTSQVVAALERHLGVRLLARTTRVVSPTQEGLLLYRRTAEHLRALADARAEIERERSDVAGEVCVTTTHDLAEPILAPLVARFVDLHPHASVRVVLGADVLDLVGRGIDFAIRAGRVRERGVVARRIGEVVLGLFASPAYLARRGVPTSDADLRDADWVLARPPHVARKRVRGLTPLRDRPRVDAQTFGLARAVAAEGGGLAILPTFVAEEDVRARRLERVLPERSIVVPLLLAYAAAQKLPRRAQVFRDLALGQVHARPVL